MSRTPSSILSHQVINWTFRSLPLCTVKKVLLQQIKRGLPNFKISLIGCSPKATRFHDYCVFSPAGILRRTQHSGGWHASKANRLNSSRSDKKSNIILRSELYFFMRYREGCINADLMEISIILCSLTSSVLSVILTKNFLSIKLHRYHHLARFPSGKM